MGSVEGLAGLVFILEDTSALLPLSSALSNEGRPLCLYF